MSSMGIPSRPGPMGAPNVHRPRPDLPRSDAPSIAVVGVGNEFRGDDGAGRAVLDRVAQRSRRRPLPAGAALWTCEGEPARLLSLWEHAQAAVVVDAARTDGSPRPGRIRRFEGAGALARYRPATASSHGLGLAAAIELGRVLERLPRKLIVYTVEGGEFGLGACLSPIVSAAVELTALYVEGEVRHLAREPAPITLGGHEAGRGRLGSA